MLRSCVIWTAANCTAPKSSLPACANGFTYAAKSLQALNKLGERYGQTVTLRDSAFFAFGLLFYLQTFLCFFFAFFFCGLYDPFCQDP